MAVQEEIEQKSFNLMISTTKLSARTVLRAVKAAIRLYQSKASQGKQSVRTLLRQNRGVSSVEISKTGIRGLERYAKKYGIVKLLNALNISADTLLCDLVPSASHVTDDEIRKRLEGLTPIQKKAALDLLDTYISNLPYLTNEE